MPPDPTATVPADQPDWSQINQELTDMLVPAMAQEMAKLQPQSEKVMLVPGAELTVSYDVSLGQLLTSTLLFVLISLQLVMFFHRLILKKRG